MRKTALAAAACVVVAMPMVANATTAPGEDPAKPGEITTEKALAIRGQGQAVYTGSGGVTITNARAVRVVDLSAAKDLSISTGAYGRTRQRPSDGGYGFFKVSTLTLNGSDFRVRVNGKLKVDVDPTTEHIAQGIARTRGNGYTVLKAGRAASFRWATRVVLGSGPLAVDLVGRNAVWRLNGPANGTTDMTMSGTLRILDRTTVKDLSVVVPAGTTSSVDPKDGATVYTGLKNAKVAITGSGYRFQAFSRNLRGTFTPVAGTLARSNVRGAGRLSVGPADGRLDNLRVPGGRYTRVVLQP